MIWKMYISTGHIIHIHVLISLVFCFTSSNVHDWLLCVSLSVITINKVLSKCGFIILWTILECTYLEMRQKKKKMLFPLKCFYMNSWFLISFSTLQQKSPFFSWNKYWNIKKKLIRVGYKTYLYEKWNIPRIRKNVIEILKIHGKKSILLDKFNADIFHVRGSGLFIC